MTASYLLNDTDAFNLCVSPEKAYSFQDLENCANAEIINPFFDYVEPDLLSLLITDFGPHPPQSIARIFDNPQSL